MLRPILVAIKDKSFRRLLSKLRDEVKQRGIALEATLCSILLITAVFRFKKAYFCNLGPVLSNVQKKWSAKLLLMLHDRGLLKPNPLSVQDSDY